MGFTEFWLKKGTPKPKLDKREIPNKVFQICDGCEYLQEDWTNERNANGRKYNNRICYYNCVLQSLINYKDGSLCWELYMKSSFQIRGIPDECPRKLEHVVMNQK